MGTRDELLEAVAARYRAATRTEKGRILTEFAEISGYHRKHAERLLRCDRVTDRSQPRPARRVYDQAVREALVVLWEASDRICGKRLKPLIPLLVPAMERHGHLALVFGASAAAHPQMTSDALRNMEASRVRGHQEPSDHGARGSKHSQEHLAEATT